MQVIRDVIDAYEAVSNPKASLLRKAEGYLILLRELMEIGITEHKGVQLFPLPTEKKFLQSLCTRLSKALKTAEKEESNAQCSANQEEESDKDSEENSDDQGEESEEEAGNELAKRFAESQKSVEEFVEELKAEVEKESADDADGAEVQGQGSTPKSTADAKPSAALEALIRRYQTITQAEEKRNYKKFLPKVWINPLVPYALKTLETVKKPLVVFYEYSGGYNHGDMVAGLKAIPETLADVFMSDDSGFHGNGWYNGRPCQFRDIKVPKTVLVFTNGCNTSHNISKFCKGLMDAGHIVEVFTVFEDGRDCGCPTFHNFQKDGVKLHRGLKV